MAIPKVQTLKVYDGPSLIKQAVRIIVLLTGFAVRSKNTKTGGMIQSYILRYDIAPHLAVKSGADEAVCGNCKLRPAIFVKDEVSPRKCYVNTWQGARSTWVANRDRAVEYDLALEHLEGRKLRKGTYGDPGAVPAHIWEGLESAATGDTGYTHRWKDVGANLQAVCMASVHGADETRLAWKRGFRTFRVLQPGESMLKGEISCPASKEAGALTTCEQCGLCNGAQGSDDRRKSIVILAH